MVSVIKADGTSESFSEEKVRNSLSRAGVSGSVQDNVLKQVKSKLYDGMQTWEIYHHVRDTLKKSSHPYSFSKYSLKQSIMMLGPTGYPFEDFIARVLEIQGFSTLTRQIIPGKCVTHEIDVIAKKKNEKIMVEAKFHNNTGTRSDIHVAMYTKARFDDVKVKNDFTEGWLITNTKVTTEAIAYAACENLRVVGWSYPVSASLSDMIEETNLHPITMLSTLNMTQKAELLQNHIVLCKDICTNHSLLNNLHLSDEERKRTLEEIGFVCKGEGH